MKSRTFTWRGRRRTHTTPQHWPELGRGRKVTVRLDCYAKVAKVAASQDITNKAALDAILWGRL